jgi:hypothetical protein
MQTAIGTPDIRALVMTAYLFSRIGVLDVQGLDNPGLGFELLVGFTSGAFMSYSRIVPAVEEQCLLKCGSPYLLQNQARLTFTFLRRIIGMKSRLLFDSLTGFLFFALLTGLACGETAIRSDQASQIAVQPSVQLSKTSNPITMFLCGDVMTGRGIDQLLPHPNDPLIYESYMKSARGYVALAERMTGSIQKPVSFSYIWGDVLEELERVGPDVRIINLETSVTKSDDYAVGKGIHL